MDTFLVLATGINGLVFYPFLVVLAIAAVGLGISGVRRFMRKMDENRYSKLVKAGKWDRLAALALDKGNALKAAQLMRENDQGSRAIDLLISANQYIEAARAAMDLGDAARAAELFQRGGDLSTAGACHLAAGNLDAALLLLKQIDELDVAARFLERKGQPELATQVYLDSGALDKAAALALEQLKDREQIKDVANRLEQAKEYDMAMSLYKKGRFMLEYGNIAARTGKIDAAIDTFLQSNYFEEAATLYSRSGKHRQAAECYVKGGLVSKAVEEMLLAGEYLAVARLFHRSGQPARALDILKSITIDSDRYKDGQLLACSIQIENQRFKQAVEILADLLEVIGFTTANLEIIYRLVDLQLQVGDRDDAIATLEVAKRTGLTDPRIDEQLMKLRESPDSLFVPEALDFDASSTVPASQKPPMRGASTTIGFPRSDRYTLKRKLARGGHGILYLVQDRKLERDVVLKLLHSESLPSDLARKYFFREARTAASLNHPNIVQVYDYGDLDSRPFLAMEFVDGLNLIELQDSLKQEIPMDRRVVICIQLCQALAYAHSKTIIHRDIKMENVMVDTRWQTKLMDFGLAKALNENPDRSLFIIGTPFYMSPEQIIGDSLDRRTDIYSVGVLMYRLFTGRLPFEEGEILSHHRFTPPPDPREYKPDLNNMLAETILVCLKKDREERFDDATLIAQRLKDIQDNKS
jgi:eukaryotic-like serine/threonine-protein kinase